MKKIIIIQQFFKAINNTSRIILKYSKIWIWHDGYDMKKKPQKHKIQFTNKRKIL